MMRRWPTLLALATLSSGADAFATPGGRRTAGTTTQSNLALLLPQQQRIGGGSAISSPTALDATGGKKRRRKRKKASSSDAAAASSPASAPAAAAAEVVSKVDPPKKAAAAAAGLEADIAAAKAGGFDFKTDDAIGAGVEDDEMTPLDLPDIRTALQRKQEKEDEEEERKVQEEFKPKVNRGDMEAMKKLLETTPFADADDTLFEAEEYGTVSALLAENTKPFLGIGSGPLQVGHFIGALAIILMAYVEYPGFPLTNLPTPLRDFFQGGLGTVYLINTVLAGIAALKAGERGQSSLLWGAKTFSVGGLAYDQLMQLPTLEETERRKAVKGKRALK